MQYMAGEYMLAAKHLLALKRANKSLALPPITADIYSLLVTDNIIIF